jgi:hypothetical protein
VSVFKGKNWVKIAIFHFFLKKWRDGVREWKAWLSSLVTISTTKID